MCWSTVTATAAASPWARSAGTRLTTCFTSAAPRPRRSTGLRLSPDPAFEDQVERDPGERAGGRIVLQQRHGREPRVGEQDVPAELGGVGLHEGLDGGHDPVRGDAHRLDVIAAGPCLGAAVDGDLLVTAAAAERRPCLLRVRGGLGGRVVGGGEGDQQLERRVEAGGGGPVVDSGPRGGGAEGGGGREKGEQKNGERRDP